MTPCRRGNSKGKGKGKGNRKGNDNRKSKRSGQQAAERRQMAEQQQEARNLFLTLGITGAPKGRCDLAPNLAKIESQEEAIAFKFKNGSTAGGAGCR